ncbi:MAG: hypothetical protein ACHQUC_04835 [Chlamydiales bacterium]
MLPPIRCCEYNYHSGCAPDRKISFYENDSRLIEAHVEGKINGTWENIAILSEDRILLEGEPLASRMKRYTESIALGVRMEFKPDKSFAELDLEKKKEVIQRLTPHGQYSFQIFFAFGTNPKFEIIRRIGFFDDSADKLTDSVDKLIVKEVYIDVSFIGYYIYPRNDHRCFDGKLDFYEVGSGKIEARINTKVKTGWNRIGAVSEENICVEAESGKEKTKRLAEDRQLGKSLRFLPSIKFSDLDIAKKKSLILQLHPEGPYHIWISYPSGEGVKYADISQIHFYNPL